MAEENNKTKLNEEESVEEPQEPPLRQAPSNSAGRQGEPATEPPSAPNKAVDVPAVEVKPEPQVEADQPLAKEPEPSSTLPSKASADKPAPSQEASKLIVEKIPAPAPQPTKPAPAPPVKPSSAPISSELRAGRPAPTPKVEQIPFKTKFKNKLFELRKLANQKRFEKVEKNLEKIMQYAMEKQKITNNEVEKLTGIGDKQAERYLKILVKKRKLVKFGKTKNTFYKPVK